MIFEHIKTNVKNLVSILKQGFLCYFVHIVRGFVNNNSENINKEKMTMNDTVNLLKECNSGCKTAVDGMDQVKDRVKSKRLKSIIEDCSARHTEYGERCRNLLNSVGKSEMDPPAVGMTMAHIGTSVKLAINDGDRHIAEMMLDGANMGIKSLAQQLNLYPSASEESKTLTKDIINEELGFYKDMLSYL